MTILYRDDCLIACLKPVGALSEDKGANCVPAMLREEVGGFVAAVHRLDKVASGVMIYSVSESMTGKITQSFHDTGEKTYCIVVSGDPGESGTLEDLLYHDQRSNKTFVVKRMRKGVREAKLSFERVSVVQFEGKVLSLLRVHLVTGRTHQIRVQFASRGFPLVGDRRYGSTVESENVALWSEEISFLHPKTKKRMTFRHAPQERFPYTLFNME